MFKKAIILVIILFLALNVFSVRLIDPISKELSQTTNFVGNVALGNTIELIFSKELANRYENLVIVSPLPDGFTSQIKYEKESIKLFINAPVNASVGDYPLSVNFSGPTRSDNIDIYFSVVSGVLDVSPSSAAQQTVLVGSPAEYKFFFKNSSDASAIFTIETNLPASWNQDNLFAIKQVIKTITVPKHQSMDDSIFVYPRLQGKTNFRVKVYFEDTNKEFSFDVIGSPTLKSKLSSVSQGLPFYSFSMLPSYFLNGIVSFWFN